MTLLIFLDIFKYRSQDSNTTLWEDSRYIDTLNKSDLAKNRQERRSYLVQAEKILMEEMPIIPLFYYTFSSVQNSHLHNVTVSDTGILDFRHAYFE